MGNDGRHSSCLEPRAATAPERRQWQRIFRALLEMLGQRQRQLETLDLDRSFLQEFVHLQHDRWTSKVCFLESQMSQMRKEEEMAKRVEAAKMGLMVALRQREASCYKELAEDADKDLQDFCEYVEALSCEISVMKEKLHDGKNKETSIRQKELSCHSSAVEDGKVEENNSSVLRELRKWKQAYKKLSSVKETEVSALLSEKDFVWHQLKKMESDYTGLLKSKQIEVDQANEALERLQANVVELQSSTADKDEMISKLKDDISRIELELKRHTNEAQKTGEELNKLHLDMEMAVASLKAKDDMIAKLQGELVKFDARSAHMKQYSNRKPRLLKESTSLTRSRTDLATPSRHHQGIPLTQGSCLSHSSFRARTAGTGSRQSSKRKLVPRASLTALDSPTLFPTTFKVPKLKNLSPAV